MILRAAKRYITVIDLKNNKSTIFTAATQVREVISGMSYDKFKVITKNSDIAFYSGYIIAISHEPPVKQHKPGTYKNLLLRNTKRKTIKDKAMDTPK
jgi:hypothetical protein